MRHEITDGLHKQTPEEKENSQTVSEIIADN
jgi:hypothetical protein